MYDIRERKTTIRIKRYLTNLYDTEVRETGLRIVEKKDTKLISAISEVEKQDRIKRLKYE